MIRSNRLSIAVAIVLLLGVTLAIGGAGPSADAILSDRSGEPTADRSTTTASAPPTATPTPTPTPTSTTTPTPTSTTTPTATPTPTSTTTPTPTATRTATSGTPSASDSTPSIHDDYEQTVVTVRSADGAVRGSVTAAIADNRSLRYIGLSDSDSLPDDRGMLFVYESHGDRTFVMREMSFGIDIVYVAPNGTITEIHHAPAPDPDEDGSAMRYPGSGQYVLEVPYGWTIDRNVDVGDRVDFEL
ncbi:MAG: DUF192 domain-containing protein [Halobacteriota archaeon]